MPRFTLRRKDADRHRLYELAVQDAALEVKLVARQYRRRRGRRPHVLREDFCGTASVACRWVRAHEGNRAIGLDLDAPTLEWAHRHNVAELGSAAPRVDLRLRDVRSVTRPPADVVVALNFSSYLFYPVSDLVAYLRLARRSLAPGGIIVLDGYGGWESGQVLRERRTVKSAEGAFGYVWDQVSFNPIDNLARCDIHFAFKNRKKWRRAFTYRWRVYTPAELRDALSAAGFRNIEVLWDVATDPSVSTYRAASTAENCPGWLFYVVADGPPLPEA